MLCRVQICGRIDVSQKLLSENRLALILSITVRQTPINVRPMTSNYDIQSDPCCDLSHHKKQLKQVQFYATQLRNFSFEKSRKDFKNFYYLLPFS